jgi:hypothetical protein
MELRAEEAELTHRLGTYFCTQHVQVLLLWPAVECFARPVHCGSEHVLAIWSL